MKTYTIYTEAGQIEIEEKHLHAPVKRLLVPILTEIGLGPERIAKYGDDLDSLIGLIIAHVRQQNERLDRARVEFKKVRDAQDDDRKTMMAFIRSFQGLRGLAEQAENVVDLEARRKAA